MKKYTVAAVVKIATEHTWADRPRKGVQKFSQEIGSTMISVTKAKMEKHPF